MSLAPNVPYSFAIANIQHDLNCTVPQARAAYDTLFLFDSMNFDDHKQKVTMMATRLRLATIVDSGLSARNADLERYLGLDDD